MPPSLMTRAVVPTAHPETSHPHVEVPTLLVLVAVLAVVVVAAVAVPARASYAGQRSGPGAATTSWHGSLSAPQRVSRAVAVLLLVLAVVAGRAGVDNELENLAPALVVGAGWPLLVLGCLVLGTLWRWVDPWDALARVAVPGDTSTPPGHVWPAVALLPPLLWYLGVHSRPLDPRSVGAALAAYTVVTLAGCVAVGRTRWLASGEPVGILLSWVGLVPRRALTSWHPPRGAGALLGATVGGLLLGMVRRTELWGPVAVHPYAVVWTTAALLGACLLGAAVATAAVRAARALRAEAGTAVLAGLVVVSVGIALAVALSRNRFFHSVQLLPGLVGDPLGRGWDLLGPAADGLQQPLSPVGLVTLQLLLVAGAHLAAALTVPRALVGDERLPVIAVLALSAAASVTVFSLH